MNAVFSDAPLCTVLLGYLFYWASRSTGLKSKANGYPSTPPVTCQSSWCWQYACVRNGTACTCTGGETCSDESPIRCWYPREMFIYCIPGCDGHSSPHPHGHGKGRNFTRRCYQKNMDGGLQGTDSQGKFVSKAILHFLSTSCKLKRGQSRQTPWILLSPSTKAVVSLVSAELFLLRGLDLMVTAWAELAVPKATLWSGPLKL